MLGIYGASLEDYLLDALEGDMGLTLVDTDGNTLTLQDLSLDDLESIMIESMAIAGEIVE